MLRFRTLLQLMIISASPLLAQSYDEIQRSIESRNFLQADAAIRARLSQDASDDSAHYFAGMIPIVSGDKDHLDEAAEHLRTCVRLKPACSDYHLWLGRALGMKAQNAGIFAAIGYVGEIKGSFIKAVELDPRNYDARYDLVQFYLQAPGIAGGSVSRARDVAADCAGYDGGMAAVLQAAIHVYKEDYDDARNTLTAVKEPSSPRVANYVRSTWLSLGFKCLTEKEPEEARRVFESIIMLYPDMAYGYHGLGRSLLDLKRYDEAIPPLEKALAMNDQIGSHYRLALVYKAKGDRPRAIEYLRRFQREVHSPSPQTVSDVKNLLHELGAE